MTLLELRAHDPHLFCPQVWYESEAFARHRAYPAFRMPSRVDVREVYADDYLPRAVDLAHLYVHSPHNLIWRNYLWCADTDAEGQRVYVGGTANGRGFEIHRHLHLTERWGVLAWE